MDTVGGKGGEVSQGCGWLHFQPLCTRRSVNCARGAGQCRVGGWQTWVPTSSIRGAASTSPGSATLGSQTTVSSGHQRASQGRVDGPNAHPDVSPSHEAKLAGVVRHAETVTSSQFHHVVLPHYI